MTKVRSKDWGRGESMWMIWNEKKWDLEAQNQNRRRQGNQNSPRIWLPFQKKYSQI